MAVYNAADIAGSRLHSGGAQLVEFISDEGNKLVWGLAIALLRVAPVDRQTKTVSTIDEPVP